MTHDEIEAWFTRDNSSASAFICRCGTDSGREADDFLAEVKRQLIISRGGTGIPDNLFLTYVVIDLNWHHNAYISGIHNDQWSCVDAKVYEDGERNPYDVRIQCDNVEDGIAGVWWAYTHRVPMSTQESPEAGVPDDDDGRVLR